MNIPLAAAMIQFQLYNLASGYLYDRHGPDFQNQCPIHHFNLLDPACLLV